MTDYVIQTKNLTKPILRFLKHFQKFEEKEYPGKIREKNNVREKNSPKKHAEQSEKRYTNVGK